LPNAFIPFPFLAVSAEELGMVNRTQTFKKS